MIAIVGLLSLKMMIVIVNCECKLLRTVLTVPGSACWLRKEILNRLLDRPRRLTLTAIEIGFCVGAMLQIILRKKEDREDLLPEGPGDAGHEPMTLTDCRSGWNHRVPGTADTLTADRGSRIEGGW